MSVVSELRMKKGMADTRVALQLAAQIKGATVPRSHWLDPPAPPVCVSSCFTVSAPVLIFAMHAISSLTWQSNTHCWGFSDL